MSPVLDRMRQREARRQERVRAQPTRPILIVDKDRYDELVSKIDMATCAHAFEWQGEPPKAAMWANMGVAHVPAVRQAWIEQPPQASERGGLKRAMSAVVAAGVMWWRSHIRRR